MRAAIRIFLKGLVFATRPRRRVAAFAASFVILSALTFISISLAEQSWTVDLRRDTAVWIAQEDWNTAREDDARAVVATLGDFKPVEEIAYVRYLEEGGTRIFGVDVSHAWASEMVSPGKIARGRYLRSESGEAVTAGYLRCSDGGWHASPSVGSRLSLESRVGDKPMSFTVVGEIRDYEGTKPWIILSRADFDAIKSERTKVYVHELIFLARGSATLPGIFGNPYENVRQIHKRLGEMAPVISERNWDPRTIRYDDTEKRSISGARLAMLIAGVLGGFIVSLMYGYIISRFRMREAAVLKAMGYASWQVGILLVAEVVLVAGVGCVLGLVGVRAYFMSAALPSFVSMPAFLTLLVIFLLNCLGFFLVSMKAASVRPMELFRRKG